MQTHELLCSFGIKALPNEEVSYVYEEGESELAALERLARSTLWENARESFLEHMTEMCGGSFVLE